MAMGFAVTGVCTLSPCYPLVLCFFLSTLLHIYPLIDYMSSLGFLFHLFIFIYRYDLSFASSWDGCGVGGGVALHHHTLMFMSRQVFLSRQLSFLAGAG